MSNSKGPAPISALDGIVGTFWRDRKYFITSPNVNYIPSPPFGSQRSFYLRSDARFGDDDYIQWPQVLHPFYVHFTVIPRTPSAPNLNIMWWRPTRADFHSSQSGQMVVRGMGKLARKQASALGSCVSELLLRAEKRPSSSTPLLPPLVKTLKHAFARLDTMVTSYSDMLSGVALVQRLYLELVALLDYLEKYRPRMDGFSLPSTSHVADVVGAFTTDARVAQDFFEAGIPVWFIRPWSVFSDERIREEVALITPGSSLCLDMFTPPVPQIYEGNAGSLNKLHAMQRYSRNHI